MKLKRTPETEDKINAVFVIVGGERGWDREGDTEGGSGRGMREREEGGSGKGRWGKGGGRGRWERWWDGSGGGNGGGSGRGGGMGGRRGVSTYDQLRWELRKRTEGSLRSFRRHVESSAVGRFSVG